MNFSYPLARTMISQGLLLMYRGEFSQNMTKTILTMAERSLENKENLVIKRKVFNVMVELLQNIARHREEHIPEHAGGNNAIFLVGRENHRYNIISGNPIHKDRVMALKENLNRINALGREGLKVLYRDLIQAAALSEKGGAGLGFVDMARKSGEKLRFAFPEISDRYCFFCLRVQVSRDHLNL